MAQIFQMIVRNVLRLVERRNGESMAAGDRKGTPEARAKSMNTARNLIRNRRMLSVLRRP